MGRSVRKAVFPVGGLGTRFLPATKAMPKEMLPIVDKPLIQYAVEEAWDAGIEEVFLMVSEVGINNVTAIVSPYDMRTNTKRIEIPGIIWEQELYDLIGAEFVRHFGAKK